MVCVDFITELENGPQFPFKNKNNLINSTQTTPHATETALIKVSNALLLAADAGEHSILMLLDRSSALDTADFTILINSVEKYVPAIKKSAFWTCWLISGSLHLSLFPRAPFLDALFIVFFCIFTLGHIIC